MRRVLLLFVSIPQRRRRWWFVTKAKLVAKAKGIDLRISVAKSAIIGNNVTLDLERGQPIKITIGEKVTIEDGVRFQARAGLGYPPELYIGPFTIIHNNAVLIFGGLLKLEMGNEIGIGCVIRAMQAIVFASFAGTGEYASLNDYLHATDDENKSVYQKTLLCRPIKLGRTVLIATKATVQPGTVIADMAVVFPHSVITGVHEKPTSLYSGVPAKEMGRPDLFPVTNNPFLAAGVTWRHGEPGANFMTPEEALASLPDPTPYNREEWGWKHLESEIAQMTERRTAEREQRAKREAAIADLVARSEDSASTPV